MDLGNASLSFVIKGCLHFEVEGLHHTEWRSLFLKRGLDHWYSALSHSRCSSPYIKGFHFPHIRTGHESSSSCQWCHGTGLWPFDPGQNRIKNFGLDRVQKVKPPTAATAGYRLRNDEGSHDRSTKVSLWQVLRNYSYNLVPSNQEILTRNNRWKRWWHLKMKILSAGDSQNFKNRMVASERKWAQVRWRF